MKQAHVGQAVGCITGKLPGERAPCVRAVKREQPVHTWHGTRRACRHPLSSSMTSWGCVLLLCGHEECQDLQWGTVSVTPLLRDLDPTQAPGEVMGSRRPTGCPLGAEQGGFLGAWCMETPLQERCRAGDKTGGIWRHPRGSQRIHGCRGLMPVQAGTERSTSLRAPTETPSA